MNQNKKIRTVEFLIYFGVFISSVEYRFFASINGLPSVTLIELLSAFILVFTFLDSIINKKLIGESINYLALNHSYLILYFLLCGYFSVMNLFYYSDGVTLQQYKDLFPSFILMFTLSIYVNTFEKVKRVLLFFYFGGIANGYVGISQYLFGAPRVIDLASITRNKLDVSGQLIGDHVVTGFFPHPNALGIYLIPVLLICVLICVGRIRYSTAVRYFSWVSLPILLFCLVVTNAKGPIIWSAVTLIAYYVCSLKGEMRWAWLIFVISLFSMIIAGWLLADHFESARTILTRIQLWYSGVLSVFSSVWGFLFGGNQLVVYAISKDMTGGFHPYPNSHNGLINQAVLYGMPGLILFIYSVWRVISLASELLGAIYNSQVYNVLLCCAIMVLSMLFISMMEPFVEGVVLQYTFFMFVFLCVLSLKLYNCESE